MKFERFYIESSMQPYEVEEDNWVMEPSPERFGIRLLDAKTPENELAYTKVKDWCDERRVWCISNLLYFDTEAERFEFELAWL